MCDYAYLVTMLQNIGLMVIGNFVRQGVLTYVHTTADMSIA